MNPDLPTSTPRDPYLPTSTPWGPRIQFKTPGMKGKSNESSLDNKADTIAGGLFKGTDSSPSQHTPLPLSQHSASVENIHILPNQQPQSTESMEAIEEAKAETTSLKPSMTRADVEVFLSQFNPPNVKGFDQDGLTPLNKAVKEGNSQLAELLIRDLGADINGVDENGFTPLTYAVEVDKQEMLKLLKDLGADINRVDGKGQTPLTHATEFSDLVMIKLLVNDLGADINGLNGHGLTSLHYAVAIGDSEVAKLLVRECKADVNGVEGNRFSPLLGAAALGQFEMVKLLVNELEADINGSVSDSGGLTPLNVLVAEGNLEMAELFKDLGAEQDLEPLERKFLAQVWGIEGSSELRLGKTDKTIKVNYEGLPRYYSMKMLREYAAAFFDDAKTSIPKVVKDQIVSALDQRSSQDSAAEMADRVRQGKPLILTTGTKDHVISVVLFKGQLAVCNRGEGGAENAVEFFSFPSNKVTEEIISQLAAIHPNVESFNQMIEDFNLGRPLGGYHQKDQHMGNCSWASPKAAVGALLHLSFGQQEGRQLYKEFTAYTRERSLSDYKGKEPTSRDTKLIQEIEEKQRLKRERASKPEEKAA